MMFDGDKAEKNIGVLSGGEKSRVLLGKILATPSNMLFLDEPTNHLDMESIQALVESIQDYPGAVVIVTHSEMILREVATKLVIFNRGGVEVFPGNYDDFLEKIGWEEEDTGKKKKKAAPVALPNQEDEKKKRRLKKDIEIVESKIIILETDLGKSNQELVTASEKGDVDAIRRLSQVISETQSEIDELFDELTRLNA
jgi:ATP-binding cassette subfamily F protein 3